MAPDTKAKLFWAMGLLCGITATGLAVPAFLLIKAGAYPPEGTGSLGHVGMVIAGIIAAFLALISSGLTLFCVSKGRVVKNATKPFAGSEPRDRRAT